MGASGLRTVAKQSEPNFHWLFGTYDDYGWIEEQPRVDKPHFLVHRPVAEAVAAIQESSHPRRGFFERFLRVCFLARIELFGHTLLGQQYRDADETRLMLTIGEINQKHRQQMLTAQEKEEEEWADKDS